MFGSFNSIESAHTEVKDEHVFKFKWRPSIPFYIKELTTRAGYPALEARILDSSALVLHVV